MKKNFLASHWFIHQKQAGVNDQFDQVIKSKPDDKPKRTNILAPFNYKPNETVKIENQLNKFFVPGWKGESLISKNVAEFIKVIEKLHYDVRSNLLDVDRFSRRQKQAIFEEFISFAEYKTLQCPKIDNVNYFWDEFKNPESEYKPQLDLFIQIFSFRIAVIYLLKVRFILTLFENTDLKFNVKSILYPNSFLTTVFKSASSSELKARSFEQNIFSWYRPSHSLQESLLNFKEIYDKVTITEIIKTIAIKSEEILDHKTFYSHSLSNKQFGLFMNSLLINFPLWLSSLNHKSYNPFKTPRSELDIISCKYSGDYLESLGLSHWLAQNHNKELKWEQILCPDYKNDDFENGLYLKILNELQFLTFLAEVAPLQGQDTTSFLCNVINCHLYNRKNSNEVQKSLFFNETSLNHSTYDRIVLNLVEFPENNPQHFLYQRILAQKQFLKNNGFIFVLTSKKLFVPSQKTKINQLLTQLKIEGILDLSDIEGKGEVGSYIYIFSNRSEELISQNNQKHACLSFRYHDSLKTFHEFEKITFITHDFFQKNLGELPPMSQIFNGQTRLEFYQDAILDGQLIHSTNKDASSITHPSFFKQLMKLCQPLDYFFDIQNIDFNSNNKNDFSFNLDQIDQRELSPHVIIVDQRIKNQIKIEIINSSLLEAKAYEYGHAMCSYFYAFKKWPNLNVFAIVDFLNSSIGSQIINLTFNNEIRKVKGNLNKILIPNFYINNKELPDHLSGAINLFKLSSEQLLNMHPRNIETSFSEIECLIVKIATDYPAQILNLLTSFKKTINKTIDTLQNGNNKNTINFNNPLLKSPLLLSKTYPIYPDNNEIYLEFAPEANQLIHAGLSQTKIISKKIGEETSYGLQLICQNSVVLTLYSDGDMIKFIDFILSHAKGLELSKVLQSVAVPKIEDLKSIINSYNLICRVLTNIQSKITPMQSRLLNSVILNENNNPF